MKRKILTLLAVVFTVATLMCVTALAVSADAEPSVTIAKFNLAFEDNTYLKYAVRFDGVNDERINENNIGMLYWVDYKDGFTPGTEKYSSKTTGYTDISGVKHYVFEYTHIAAKQLTDYIYSVAYIELDGETYYSEPVKYSALEYAYNRLGKTSEGTTNEELRILLEDMIRYGASAQRYFNYKEERLANDNYYQITVVGGTLDDGFTSGLYYPRDEIKITAPETNGDLVFCTWTNTFDDSVSTENPLIVTNLSANTTYTASYMEAIKYSEGLEYTSNGDGTCYVSGIGTCTDTDVIIPPKSPSNDLVVSIGYAAFADCCDVESVRIPDSVTNIDDEAFSWCVNLKNVEIGNKVASIGSLSFTGCGLTSIKIPNNVIDIGSGAFWSCQNLTNVEIGNRVDIIAWGAFSGTNLESIIIPDNVTSIGDEAFAYCYNLSSIELGNGLKTVGNGAFLESGLESIIIPDNVTSIGDEAFAYCYNLSSIELGNGLKTVGNGAFLESGLESIIIPNNVTSVGDEAFAYCYNLVYAKLGNGLEKINNSLFYDCGRLTSVIIGEAVTSIGEEAFFCCGLTSVKLPDSVVKIDSGAFWSCNYLTDIELGKNVTSIGGSAFLWCTELVNIKIPDSVTSVGEGAFFGCENLTSVIIGEGVESIGREAFYHCFKLESIDVNPGNTNFKSEDGNLYTKDGKTLIQYAAGKYEGHFRIPDGVEIIGDWAFSNCYNLMSIIISDSVKVIGEGAFELCFGITDVYYKGSEADWAKISIGEYNEFFGDTMIHYNYSW